MITYAQQKSAADSHFDSLPNGAYLNLSNYKYKEAIEFARKLGEEANQKKTLSHRNLTYDK